MVEDGCAGTPDVGIMVNALSWYHDDCILFQEVLVGELRVLLNLLYVDDGTMVAQGLVEHCDKSGTLFFDAVEFDNPRPRDRIAGLGLITCNGVQFLSNASYSIFVGKDVKY